MSESQKKVDDMARPGILLHPKFQRFCAIMQEADSIPPAYCLGMLEMMWHVVYQEGDPLIGDALSVKIACGYPGPADVIVNALNDAGAPHKKGFIEMALPAAGPEVWMVHDLSGNAPRYVQRRRERKGQREPDKPETDKPPAKNERDPKIDLLRQLWNVYAEAAGLPICRPFGSSENAKKKVRSLGARLREHPDLEEWATVVARLVGRPYCRGQNEKGWQATIDYLYRVSTFDDHFSGRFANVSPYILPGEADASESEAIDEYLDKLVGALRGAAEDIEDGETKTLVLIVSKGVSLLKGQPPDDITAKMYALEGELMESIAKVWPGAKAIEADCKAAERETGVKWKALRDRRIRAALHLPRLDF